MKRITGVTLAIAASMLVVGATQAFGATTRTVGPPTCQQATFSSIQAAVNASAAGDKIIVCAGTYTEQVTIPAGKDALTLQSNGPQQAIIQAPATMTSPKAIVEVTGSHNVKITDFQIQGPGGGGCDSLEYGVRVDGGGSAIIAGNVITHIRDQPFSGCQNGVGVQVGSSSASTTGNATIKSNTITDYQKNGITVSGTHSLATINNNTITGAGSTNVIAQNGIQFSGGAGGSASSNDVSGNAYSPQTVTSTGVLVFGPVDPVTVSNNTLHGNDVSAYIFDGDTNTLVSNNTITGGAFDGITLDTSNGPTVTGNTITGGDQGIGVYGTTNSVVKTNSTTGAASNGIYAGSDTSGNKFQNNTASGVSGAGHFACRDDSTGSATAHTANTWMRDIGATSSPLGICTAS